MKTIPIRLTNCNSAVGTTRSLSYFANASFNGVSTPSMHLIRVVASCNALVTPIPDNRSKQASRGSAKQCRTELSYVLRRVAHEHRGAEEQGKNYWNRPLTITVDHS